MIPDFNDDGYLPPGVHLATLAEVEERLGWQSEVRAAEMESLRWLVDLCRRAGVLRVIVNGSFVTDVAEPNDVDCVLLIGPGFPRDAQAEKELRDGLPFLDIEFAESADFDLFVGSIYATDRHATPKGMIEVPL